jgi:hypothetical protein
MRRLSCGLALAGLAAITAAAAQTPPNGIGYPSVAAALQGVRAKPGANVTVQGGWTVVSENGGLTLWSFTPVGHPAHPAVVRRRIFQKDSAWLIDMQGLCEAKKPACDQLMMEFEALNEQMRQSIRRGKQP